MKTYQVTFDWTIQAKSEQEAIEIAKQNSYHPDSTEVMQLGEDDGEDDED